MLAYSAGRAPGLLRTSIRRCVGPCSVCVGAATRELMVEEGCFR